MCLKTTRGIGYQVFRRGKFGRLYPLFFTCSYEQSNKRKTVPIMEWEEDKNNIVIYTDDDTEYVCGFHIILDLDAARALRDRQDNRVIRVVNFSDVTTFGYQECTAHTLSKVVVAKKRFVHGEDIT